MEMCCTTLKTGGLVEGNYPNASLNFTTKLKFSSLKNKFHEKLSDPEWLWDLAFLADITHHVNDLNTRLQGKGRLVCDMF
jgi:hypothetical protein